MLSDRGISLDLRNFVSRMTKPSRVMSPNRKPQTSARRRPVAAISPMMQCSVCGVIELAGGSCGAASINILISVSFSKQGGLALIPCPAESVPMELDRI